MAPKLIEFFNEIKHDNEKYYVTQWQYSQRREEYKRSRITSINQRIIDCIETFINAQMLLLQEALEDYKILIEKCQVELQQLANEHQEKVVKLREKKLKLVQLAKEKMLQYDQIKQKKTLLMQQLQEEFNLTNFIQNFLCKTLNKYFNFKIKILKLIQINKILTHKYS